MEFDIKDLAPFKTTHQLAFKLLIDFQKDSRLTSVLGKTDEVFQHLSSAFKGVICKVVIEDLLVECLPPGVVIHCDIMQDGKSLLVPDKSTKEFFSNGTSIESQVVKTGFTFTGPGNPDTRVHVFEIPKALHSFWAENGIFPDTRSNMYNVPANSEVGRLLTKNQLRSQGSDDTNLVVADKDLKRCSLELLNGTTLTCNSVISIKFEVLNPSMFTSKCKVAVSFLAVFHLE